MAELYTKGPAHVKGRWAVCATAAGMAEPPAADDPMMKMLIERHNGAVLPDAPALDPISALMDATDSGIPWAQLRSQLADVIQSVANGSTRATAAQVAMLKYIVEEAKTAEIDDADKLHHIVLLPVVGDGPTLGFDPEYRARISALEATAPNAST